MKRSLKQLWHKKFKASGAINLSEVLNNAIKMQATNSFGKVRYY